MQNNNSNIGYTSKYDEMLKQYNLDITDEEVKAAVKKIIEEKVAENNNVEVKKFLLGSVELTTLKTTSLLQFTNLVVNIFIIARKEFTNG